MRGAPHRIACERQHDRCQEACWGWVLYNGRHTIQVRARRRRQNVALAFAIIPLRPKLSGHVGLGRKRPLALVVTTGCSDDVKHRCLTPFVSLHNQVPRDRKRVGRDRVYRVPFRSKAFTLGATACLAGDAVRCRHVSGGRARSVAAGSAEFAAAGVACVWGAVAH